MKRSFLSVVAFFGSCYAATLYADELLLNGALEATVNDEPLGWSVQIDPPDRPEIVRTPEFANHTSGGLRGVWFSSFFGAHRSFEDDPVAGSIEQTVSVEPGKKYLLTGWSLFEPNYSGGVELIDPSSNGFYAGQPSPTQTEFSIEFFDSSGNALGTTSLDLRQDRVTISPTMNANDGLWHRHSLLTTAPSGSRFALFTAQMNGGVFNADPLQSAFLDDFSLRVVPEPCGVALANLALAFNCMRRLRP